ncbi:MAG: hypothetical protein J7502_08635 [Flavisolibacter sp.]|nr:hypothetical protein [Flavisolibacter sp.]
MNAVLPGGRRAVLFCLWFILIQCITAIAGDPQISIVVDQQRNAPFEHGLVKLIAALKAKNISIEQVNQLKAAKGNSIIVAATGNSSTIASLQVPGKNHTVAQTAEALTIWKTIFANKPVLVINGFDDRGIMYGLLDVADRISWADKNNPLAKVREVVEKPAVAERAVSVYTMNRSYWESRFYDEAYWGRYFDMLARDRFNMFTIVCGYENGGFLAPPYPYFFDVDEYPGIQMKSLTQQDKEKNLAALNRIIQLAHDRGIGVTVGIWDHIYRGGIQAGNLTGSNATAKKYEFVSGMDADNLMPYTKVALDKFIKLVPGLDAIQFRMHDESGLKKGEQEPFWKGIFESIKANHPKMRLVLRAKGLPDETIQDAVTSGVNFSIATKFWMEQAALPYSPTHVNIQDQKNRRHGYGDMLRYPQQYNMIWRLWTGGANRILIWGSPDYASRFVKSFDIYDKGSYGFEVNEMLATKMESQPHDEKPFDLLNPLYKYYDYEFERYWDFYLSYGRMGYNPQTPSEVWHNAYKQHFGEKAGPVVESAIHTASTILPRIVAACNNYTFFPTTVGWAEKQRFGDLQFYAKAQSSDIQQFASFDEEAKQLIEGSETAKILPSVTSVWFKKTSDSVNRLIAAAQNAIGTKSNKEFNSTIVDLKILSNLALYHSRRIPAAIYYCIYKRTNNPSALDSAITHERNAIAAWRQIVTAAGDVYASDLKFGLDKVKFEGISVELTGHWKDELVMLQKNLDNLEKELATGKTAQPLQPIPSYKPAAEADNSKYFTVIHQPVLTAPAGKPIKISVKVTTPASVKWVRLQFRSVNQYLDYTMLPMKLSETKDTYEVIIPADKFDPKWNLMYLIEMMDNNNRGFIFPDLNKQTPYIVTNLIR